MTKLKEDNLVAQWEQKVIEYVMRTSYSNIDTIKDILKELFKVSIIDTNGKMKKQLLGKFKNCVKKSSKQMHK